MGKAELETVLWFEHRDGQRLYPWHRHAKHRNLTAFWVSDGSNLIADAEPVDTMEELVTQVFQLGRSVWLHSRDGLARSGLYRWGLDALTRWDAEPALKRVIEEAIANRAAAPRSGRKAPNLVAVLPTEIEKAVREAGFNRIVPVADGGVLLSTVEDNESAWIRVRGGSTEVALPLDDGLRVGLLNVRSHDVPAGMKTIGAVNDATDLLRVLNAARTLLKFSPGAVSERVQKRLDAITSPEERRMAVQRVGQDVYREALGELWQGRCAISGIALPSRLLRGSHITPWAASERDGKLDPFNGLLLAVNFDALFDAGLITVSDDGDVLVSPHLDEPSRQLLGVAEPLRVIWLAPGHLPYLAEHRRTLAAWSNTTRKVP